MISVTESAASQIQKLIEKQHAEATGVDVEIRYAREQFRLRVQDDGKGFDLH